MSPLNYTYDDIYYLYIRTRQYVYQLFWTDVVVVVVSSGSSFPMRRTHYIYSTTRYRNKEPGAHNYRAVHAGAHSVYECCKMCVGTDSRKLRPPIPK
jgi:hypothetical protein